MIIITPQCHGIPILFLDCDHVLTPENGGELDPAAVERVATLLRQVGGRAVLCSSRQNPDAFHDELVEVGMPRHLIGGTCDPNKEPEDRESPATARIVQWLETATRRGVVPLRWAILDDARTLAHDWRTCTQHVAPRGPVVDDDDIGRLWSLLTGKPQRLLALTGEVERLRAESAELRAAYLGQESELARLRTETRTQRDQLARADAALARSSASVIAKREPCPSCTCGRCGQAYTMRTGCGCSR